MDKSKYSSAPKSKHSSTIKSTKYDLSRSIPPKAKEEASYFTATDKPDPMHSHSKKIHKSTAPEKHQVHLDSSAKLSNIVRQILGKISKIPTISSSQSENELLEEIRGNFPNKTRDATECKNFLNALIDNKIANCVELALITKAIIHGKHPGRECDVYAVVMDGKRKDHALVIYNDRKDSYIIDTWLTKADATLKGKPYVKKVTKNKDQVYQLEENGHKYNFKKTSTPDIKLFLN